MLLMFPTRNLADSCLRLVLSHFATEQAFGHLAGASRDSWSSRERCIEKLGF